MKRGELPRNPLWWRVDFQLPKRPTVDSGRDETSRHNGYKLGLDSLDAIMAEKGEDWVEHRTQREAELLDLCQRAERLAKQYQKQGMTFAMALSRLEQFTPNANEVTAVVGGKEPTP
jgi:hypothetical protein